MILFSATKVIKNSDSENFTLRNAKKNKFSFGISLAYWINFFRSNKKEIFFLLA